MQACCTDKALNCVLRRRVEQCCRWNGLTFSSPSVGFINVCVNYPRIYAARYEVFKQSVRKLLRRDGNGVANATASALVWQLFVCGLHHFHTCAVQASAALCCSANFFRRRGRLLLSYGRFTRLRNDLYCVEWGVKLYSLTHLRKVYVLTAVTAIPSRSSRPYICGFMRFSMRS